MIKQFAILSFSLLLFASDVYGTEAEKEKVSVDVYAIELFLAKSIDEAKKLLKKVPANLLEETHIYKMNNLIEARYSQAPSYSELKPYIAKFREAGFKDAYIIKSTQLSMREGRIDVSVEKTAPIDYTPASEKVSTANYPPMSNEKGASADNVPKSDEKALRIEYSSSSEKASMFSNSDMVIKAQNAYEEGDASSAIIYFEMLLASGDANQKIKNNLCYLYGKQGAWLEAKVIIEKEKYNGTLIYAYAYGAVESNKESFYGDLLPYIELDKSGHLMLLCGYYFEKREDEVKSLSFYKMAYEKNQSDSYNTFAYARALDMRQESKKALSLYKSILQKAGKSHPLYQAVQKRALQLGE
ncbi:MAG: hypothetical protein NTW78_06275 [Campylobacterales bacterium]|nr:hypothetical protein [Campylobacterales bacterium]